VADPFFRVALIAMGALTTFWGFGNFFPSLEPRFLRPSVCETIVCTSVSVCDCLSFFLDLSWTLSRLV
jgi:hypothetical protein